MSDILPPPTSPDDPPDWEALARYQAGECAESEARAVAAWLAAHPADERVFTALAHAVAEVGSEERSGDRRSFDVEGALRRVKVRRDEEQHAAAAAPARVVPLRPVAERRVRHALRSRLRWMGVAVASAAAVVAAVALFRGRDDVEPTAGSATGVRVLATAFGARDSLQLADGTRIVVAPGSRITVAADYGTRHREIRLQGAAWFSVHHDARRPFTVRANDAVIRDVGTEFTVRTDGVDGDRGVAVGVTDGVVALGSARSRDTVLLSAGDRGAVRADGAVVAERGVVTPEDAAWRQGRLVYRGAPLAEVRADLRRWYDVDLQIPDSALASRRLTATFAGDSLARVLDVLALALGADLERVGGVAILRPARGPR